MKDDYNNQNDNRLIIDAIDQTDLGMIDLDSNKFSLMPRTFIAPLDILFEITTICNFACLHCFNKSGPKGVTINKVIFNRLTKEIIELQPIRCCFSGGEPFLFPDRVLPSALEMRESGVLTSVITNGWLVDREIVAGISESFVGVQISIDGATAEIHDRIRNKEGSYRRAIAALEMLSSKIRHLQVAFVATSMNYQQLLNLVTILTDLGIAQLIIQPVVIQGRAKLRPNLGLTDGMFHQLIELVSEARIRVSGKIKIDIVEPLQTAKRRLLPGLVPNQQMYIAANGDVLCVPFLPIKVGNCSKQSLQVNWNNGLVKYFERDDVIHFLTTL